MTGCASGRTSRDLEDFLAPSSAHPSVWAAYPSRLVEPPLRILEDLSVPTADGWYPWREQIKAYPNAPLLYLRTADSLLFVDTGIVAVRPWEVASETCAPWRYLLNALPGRSSPVADEPPLIESEGAKPESIETGPVLSLCHAYHASFGHWFTESLAALVGILDPVVRGRLSIATRPLFPWQRRSLELLGVPPTAIRIADQPTLGVRDLICHSFGGRRHSVRVGPIIGTVFQRLRDRAAPIRTIEKPRFIYLTRSKVVISNRKLQEEAILERRLAAAGFRRISPETLTLDEQIAAFSRAEVIVGPHGSALANIGFAPPGCLVVDIVPSNMMHDWIYGLVRHLNHHLLVICAQRVTAEGEPDFGPFKYAAANNRYRVEIDMVLLLVRTAMERLNIA